MNELEGIIRKEKATSYRLASKESFTFFTLALIKQREIRRRTRRNLAFCGLLAAVPMLAAFPFMESLIHSYTGFLVRTLVAIVYDPVIVYLFILLLSGFVIICKKPSGS